MLFNRHSLKRQQFNAFGYTTWKSCNDLRKKAVEQEFTWSGFVISLSIAFLFVYSSSLGFNTLYEKSLSQKDEQQNQIILIDNVLDNATVLSQSC